MRSRLSSATRFRNPFFHPPNPSVATKVVLLDIGAAKRSQRSRSASPRHITLVFNQSIEVTIVKMATSSPPVSPQPYHDYERPAQGRQRAASAMSTVSATSHRSRDSKHLELTESARDKKWLHTKADPTKALAEATPGKIYHVAIEHWTLTIHS